MFPYGNMHDEPVGYTAQEIGQMIRESRKRLGVTQKDLALTSRSGAVSQGRAQHAAQRSERSGEPLRTAERMLHARERAEMPVPGSRFVLSTGSRTGSRTLLPQ